jgi:hypothetical protein
MTLCVCGCGQRADVRHHVVAQQTLRRVAGRDRALADRLRGDERGMVPMSQVHHELHHSRSRPLPLAVLPDAAFVFAAEVLGRHARSTIWGVSIRVLMPGWMRCCR